MTDHNVIVADALRKADETFRVAFDGHHRYDRMARAAIAAMRAMGWVEPGWVKCSERMPTFTGNPDDVEGGDSYLTFPHFTVMHFHGVGCEHTRDGDGWLHEWCEAVDRYVAPEWKVTHWMPLPAAPKDNA